MKTVLTGLATFAIRQGWIKENLARICVLPEKPITHKAVFTPEEIRLLWDYYEGKISLQQKPLTLLLNSFTVFIPRLLKKESKSMRVKLQNSKKLQTR